MIIFSVMNLETRFDHAAASSKWYERWEAAGAFSAGRRPGAPAYTMVIPPPNVTGALHMGHALNNTIQDIYARYHRMLGADVLWLPGTDHAGIATQNVVEKQLAAEGKSRHDFGREKFVERVWTWKAESGGTIVRQLRRLGASCDWARERFTMDEGLSRAVVEVFNRLHEEGLVYRADRLVNWCTRCHTALSDIEVEHEEKEGAFWHILYPFADGNGAIEIATTRPETLLGDTAVAVHPEDERYAGLIGRELILPVVGRRIRLIADDYVDRTFGTGAVKITPAHDLNDFEVGLRHSLPVIRAFTDDGRIAEASLEGAAADAAVHGMIGMKLAECRQAVIEALELAGQLTTIEKHVHAVGHCYRCKTVIEPHLTPQWFVRTAPLAAPAIAAVEEGRTVIVPDQWRKTYYEWMRNIRDWCVSRQIWWGHRIPAWYCKKCDAANMAEHEGQIILSKEATPIVSREKPAACPKCGGADLVRDPDVLDTWFSSALWPFSTLGWPEKTPELAARYPTSLLVTGFDILFFWVARMMMMGLKFMGDVPFREVYIHALVRDSEGRKMSKSRGNVIDPLSVIDEMGVDAFRFTLAAFCAQGRDVKLDERRIEGYRNFVTKIWNAARLVLAHPAPPRAARPRPLHRHDEGVDQADGGPAATRRDASAATAPIKAENRWILSRLSATIAAVRAGLDSYQIDKAADAIYAFFWHEYCDWYLEIAKAGLKEEDPETVATARQVLEVSLKLLHPIMPFVTDELNELSGGDRILDEAPFPESGPTDPEAELSIGRAIAIVSEIRSLRGEFGIPPATRLEAHLVSADDLAPILPMIAGLAGIEPLRAAATRPALEHFAATVAAGVEIVVPLGGVIDLDDARKRLDAEIVKAEKAIASSRKRLDDPKFTEKAPPEIIAESRATLVEREDRLRRLREMRGHL
jgi:valyl-tRNA synthetase